MKYFKNLKTQRNPTKSKKMQKKDTRKTIHTKSCIHQVPVDLKCLEDINEVLRFYRAQCASAKGNWKIVPKDSCEIYREKKRKIDHERHNRKQDGMDKKYKNVTEEETNKTKQRKDRTKTRKKNNKRLNKRSQKHNNRKHRHRCGSSGSSDTSTTMPTSCSSFSDMDLD